MKMIITTISVLLTSSVLLAAGQQMEMPVEGGPCAKMAKHGVLKLLEVNQGNEQDVSSSGLLDVRAYLTKSGSSGLTYSVSVDEAADELTVSSIFIVQVRPLDAQASKCQILSVSEVENR